MSGMELVSDHERGHVVQVLQQGVGLGLLDLADCTTRTDAALRARTREELHAVLRELPHLAAQLAEEEQPLLLTAAGAQLARRGSWIVPESVVLRARTTSVLLDFTQARFLRPITRLHLELNSVVLRVIVSRDVAVRTDEVSTTYCRLNDRTDQAQFPAQRLVCAGTVHMGGVQLRHPRRRG